jgi:aubergine-like protein
MLCLSQKYELKIKDVSQPMLVSMPKQRQRQRGHDIPIYLVPELCRMTGLSEQMRTNFPLMRDLADCTRLVPSQRMERLQHFNRRLKTNSEVRYCSVQNNVVMGTLVSCTLFIQ